MMPYFWLGAAADELPWKDDRWPRFDGLPLRTECVACNGTGRVPKFWPRSDGSVGQTEAPCTWCCPEAANTAANIESLKAVRGRDLWLARPNERAWDKHGRNDGFHEWFGRKSPDERECIAAYLRKSGIQDGGCGPMPGFIASANPPGVVNVQVQGQQPKPGGVTNVGLPLMPRWWRRDD